MVGGYSVTLSDMPRNVVASAKDFGDFVSYTLCTSNSVQWPKLLPQELYYRPGTPGPV